MECYYCNGEVELVFGDSIYPHRPDLSTLPFWACFDCKAWVGCHKDTTNTMGRLANAESRRLKSAAHAAFDPIWKSGHMTRSEAYQWLRKVTNLSAKECHMGWMDDSMLKGVARACTQYCKDKGVNAYYA